MVKKIVALLLILATSGGWFYLDYQNKLEIQAAEELRQAMIEARAQAAAREKAAIEAKANFEATIMAELTACKESAATAKSNFLEANKKPIKRKPGQFTVPPAIQTEADLTQESANAACQTTYDSRLASGL